MTKNIKKTFKGKVLEAFNSISTKKLNSRKGSSIIKIAIRNLSQEDFARIAFSKNLTLTTDE